MSTDNHLQVVGGAASGGRIESSGEAAPPAPPAALTLQQRRILAARDINAKIESLEKEIGRLSDSLGQAQESTRTHLLQLQQRSVSTMADIMRVSSRLEQCNRHHGERARTLDARLTSSINQLGRELDLTDGQLKAQKAGLQQLQERLDIMSRLQGHLERLTERQGHSLHALADETQRHFQITRAQVDALAALYQEQRQDLLALTSDHELLALQSGQLATRLAGLSDTVDANMGFTRRRFRTVAGVMAVLTLVTLGLITYFQLYPSAVPEPVRRQLAGLSLGLDTQSSRQADLRRELEGQASTLQVLQEQLRREQAETASLRAQSRQTRRQLREMRRELAALKRAESTPPAIPAQAPAALPGAVAPEREEIVMPVAYPGSRPDY